MAMLDTVLNFNGSESANKGPDWFGRPFWDMERLPGQLMGLEINSLGEANTVSSHDVLAKAQALYEGAGFTASCREDKVDYPGGSYFNRVCTINGKDGFGADNVVYSYPNGLPAYFVQQIQAMLAPDQNIYSDPNKQTLYTAPATPVKTPDKVPAKGADGTPKIPAATGSGQGGNTSTTDPATGTTVLASSASSAFSNPMLLAAGAAILFFMLKGGK